MPSPSGSFHRILLAAFALALAAICARAQTSTPISLTGFNQDLIVSAGGVGIGGTETAPGFSIQVIGIFDYYEQGLSGTTQGLPLGPFISEADPQVQFQFASAANNTNNAVLLNGGGSVTLSLVTPGSFSDLHFLANLQNIGSNTIQFTLHFSDATAHTATFLNLPDWTATNSTPVALSNMGMLGNGGYNGPLNMESLDYSLSVGDQAKTLTSFTLTYVNGPGPLMFFAASGAATAIPEPSSYAAFAGLGALGLIARRRRR